MKFEEMQRRFHELSDRRDQIEADAAPHRAQRDALQQQVASIERQIAPLTARIKQIEAPLYDLDNERGALVRALKGNTGPRPERAPRATAVVAARLQTPQEVAAMRDEMGSVREMLRRLSVRVDDIGSLADTAPDLAARVAQMERDLGDFATQLGAGG